MKKKEPLKKKSDQKVGRNPFESASTSASPRHPDPVLKVAMEDETPPKSETPKREKTTFFEKLDSALSWKLRQFSVLRYEGGSSARQISLLSVGLENPKWKSRRAWDIKLLRSKSLVLSAVSIRIHSA